MFTREMHGKVMMAEQVNHNYGMTTTTRIEGTDIVFKEVFKKITPKTSGYFTFESEVGLAGVMKNLGFPAENIAAMTTKSCAARPPLPWASPPAAVAAANAT